MRTRYAIAAVVLVLAVTALAGAVIARRPGAAHQSHLPSRSNLTRLTDPASLPRGPEPRVPVLVDGVIHTPVGPITLRLPGSGRTQVLLGEVDSRFVVGVEEGADTQFWSVARDGSARRLGPPRTYYNSSPMMGAGRILVSYSDRGTVRTTMTTVSARTGATLHTLVGPALSPLSIGAEGVVYAVGATTNAVRLWGFDGSDRKLFDTGSELLVPSYVDLARGLVVNENIDKDVYRLDFTGLGSPRAARWSTPQGSLLGISPSERYVLLDPPTADGNDPRRAIEVRRLSDGALVHRFSLARYLPWPEAAFEDETSFVVPLSVRGRRQVLVRCTITGRCERAGEPGRHVRLTSAGEL
jgi:hypothetical protein